MPGNIERQVETHLNLFCHALITFTLPSGSELAGEEILRRLPGARQTPALVYLWPPILGAQWAAEIRHNTGHCRGTAERQLKSSIFILKKSVFIYWHSCDSAQSVTKMLATYLSRFSSIADNKINCGPVLTWMEVSPNLLVPFVASISYSPLRHDRPFSYFNISSALYIFKWSCTPKNSAPLPQLMHKIQQSGCKGEPL